MSLFGQLAQEMLSVVPECLSAYKSLIDEGYGESFADSLSTELRVSRVANASVEASDVEARRDAIRQRGQSQSKA